MAGSTKQRAANLIDQAIATGVRGEVRQYLIKARDAASGGRTTALTALDFENLPVGAKVHDPDRTGLIMRHGKRTGRVWIYRYTDHVTGKKTEHQFGTYPSLSVADARARWSDMRDRLRRDLPIENIEETGGAISMAVLIDRYLTEYAKPHKRSWAMDARYLEKYVLPYYGDLPAVRFDAGKVRAILKPIAARAPREAEKVRGVLSSMFNVATRGSRKIGNLAGTTWVPPDTINPAAQVILPARQTASHNPTRAELAGLLQGVSDLGDVGEAIRLQAETCARVTEVAALVWDELDLDEGVWLLPADRAKNGNAHKVMLSRQSIALLQRHKRNARTAFVFPGPVSGAHLTRNSVAKAIAANREAYGLAAGFKSHSLRHACLTWLAENGAGREIRDRISNHVENTSADSIYVAAERNGAARDWLQSWCNYLDSLTAPNVDKIA